MFTSAALARAVTLPFGNLQQGKVLPLYRKIGIFTIKLFCELADPKSFGYESGQQAFILAYQHSIELARPIQQSGIVKPRCPIRLSGSTSTFRNKGPRVTAAGTCTSM